MSGHLRGRNFRQFCPNACDEVSHLIYNALFKGLQFSAYALNYLLVWIFLNSGDFFLSK